MRLNTNDLPELDRNDTSLDVFASEKKNSITKTAVRVRHINVNLSQMPFSSCTKVHIYAFNQLQPFDKRWR